MNWSDVGIIGLLVAIWGAFYLIVYAGKKIDEWHRIRQDAIDSHRALNEAIALYNYGAKQEAIELLEKHSIPHNARDE